MNVRIDEETKARGDEVFARWGLTPSQVVRAVWEYAEEKGEPPAFMRPARGAEHDAEVQPRLALVQMGIRDRIFSEHWGTGGDKAGQRPLAVQVEESASMYYGTLEEMQAKMAEFDRPMVLFQL